MPWSPRLHTVLSEVTYCRIIRARSYFQFQLFCFTFYSLTFGKYQYTKLITVLMLLEAALVGFIAIDHHWEKDLPFDPTGELDSFRSFIQDNLDICKWLSIAVIVVQYGLKSSDRHSLPI